MNFDLKQLFKKRKLAGDKSVIKELWREIFEEKLYDFESESKSPNILDIGANIGIAVLYFKNKYPDAKINAFEPVPVSFKDLKVNVGGLSDVIIHNFGLSNIDEESVIYGESDTTDKATADMLKNIKKFTDDQLKPIPVKLKKLSPFITDVVDLMKIDIEGSEGKVFKELDDSGKLKMIKEIIMEYHYNLENTSNEMGEMITRLHNNGFHLSISSIPKGKSYPIFIRAKKNSK